MTAEVGGGFSIPTPLINAPRRCAVRLVHSKISCFVNGLRLFPCSHRTSRLYWLAVCSSVVTPLKQKLTNKTILISL